MTPNHAPAAKARQSSAHGIELVRSGRSILAVLLSICAMSAAGWAAAESSSSPDEGPAAEASPEEASSAVEWELLEHDDAPGEAYELWGRLPSGSDWRAFRLIGDVEASPAVALEVAMEVSADEKRASSRETRRVLQRTPDVIVSYIRADFPLAADRDVTTRLVREYDADRGEFQLVWREANDEGPPLEEGVVRMPLARGSWTFQPLAGGHTRVVFESHADLGGSLPAWLINPFVTGTIKSNIVDLRAAIARRGG